MTELNLHETGAGGTADGGHVRTDQFPLLLCVQQQSNKCCLRSPVHESHCLNYSNCDVFDCTLDSEHNDLLTCPFGFSYRPKSNQLFDSMSPVLFNDMWFADIWLVYEIHITVMYAHLNWGMGYTVLQKNYHPAFSDNFDRRFSHSSNFWYSYYWVNILSKRGLISHLTYVLYICYLEKLQDPENHEFNLREQIYLMLGSLNVKL